LLAFDASELDALGDQLHRLFIRFAGDGIALDYNRLLWDLRKWNKSAEDIKARWACDFWQAPLEAAQGATQ
jgi:CRISPR type I-E-associated protein CasB/Cse2